MHPYTTSLAIQFIELIVLLPLICMAIAYLPLKFFNSRKPVRVKAQSCCRARK